MPVELDHEIYRAVLENLPTGVYLVDRNRRILLWNSGAEKLTGYLRQEVVGRSCPDNLLMHCDETNPVLCGAGCPLLQTIHDGRAREADVFLRHKDGQRIPVRVRAVPLRGEDDAIIGVVESFDERIVFHAADAGGPVLALVHCVDELTHVPDRRATLARLQAALADFETSRNSFGVLSIAIDNLDHLRHVDGCNAVRTVLYATAQTLLRNLDQGDLTGRWSEERFVAIVRHCTAGTLVKAAERLRWLVSVCGPPWWGDRLSIAASMGGTMVRAGDTPESLVDRAEEALQNSLLEQDRHVVVN